MPPQQRGRQTSSHESIQFRDQRPTSGDGGARRPFRGEHAERERFPWSRSSPLRKIVGDPNRTRLPGIDSNSCPLHRRPVPVGSGHQRSVSVVHRVDLRSVEVKASHTMPSRSRRGNGRNTYRHTCFSQKETGRYEMKVTGRTPEPTFSHHPMPVGAEDVRRNA
jgi:hypothetical protein